MKHSGTFRKGEVNLTFSDEENNETVCVCHTQTGMCEIFGRGKGGELYRLVSPGEEIRTVKEVMTSPEEAVMILKEAGL